MYIRVIIITFVSDWWTWNEIMTKLKMHPKRRQRDNPKLYNKNKIQNKTNR